MATFRQRHFHDGRQQLQQERRTVRLPNAQPPNLGNRNLTAAARQLRKTCAVTVGFNHEGEASQFQKHHQGNLTILQAQANRDLMIPELKNGSRDNAFSLISEPELEINDEGNGMISITALGLTTYNPATGQVEQSGDRKISGIMTDTEYDNQSFRMRLLNLPMQNGTPERRLKQIRDAFREEIDEEKWQRMRSATTLAFPRPERGGKVAVKVIDHTGVEHTKVLGF